MYQLSKEESNEVFKSLTMPQQEFIKNHVKRGKKTVFANWMARDKGHVLPSGATNEEIERLLDGWILDDYIDNGYVNPNTPCECGRPLRYQYIVRHKTTNETRRFGKDHFEEHVGLDAKLVKDIIKGFNEIDYEFDELMYKFRYGWDDTILNRIPEGIEIPEDIMYSIDLAIPLLKRQHNRLLTRINDFEEKRYNQRSDNQYKENKEFIPEVKVWEDPTFDLFSEEDFSTQQESFSLFEEDDKTNSSPSITVPTKFLLNKAVDYLYEGITSTRLICELLIKEHDAKKERYLTKKPKIYLDILNHFFSLEKQGLLMQVNRNDHEDVEFTIR